MVHEIEQKLRLSGGALGLGVLDRCRELATNQEDWVIQRDEYFDTANEELRQSDFTVRIRQTPGKAVVALKGPRIHDPTGAYRRIELEFEMSDEGSVRAQLEKLGLVRAAVIDKRRYECSIQQCIVALDTVPVIGSFLEIEGPSTEAIDATKAALGLSDAIPVRENYTELLESAFVAMGRPIRPHLVAIFDSENGQMSYP